MFEWRNRKTERALEKNYKWWLGNEMKERQYRTYARFDYGAAEWLYYAAAIKIRLMSRDLWFLINSSRHRAFVWFMRLWFVHTKACNYIICVVEKPALELGFCFSICARRQRSSLYRVKGGPSHRGMRNGCTSNCCFRRQPMPWTENTWLFIPLLCEHA